MQRPEIGYVNYTLQLDRGDLFWCRRFPGGRVTHPARNATTNLPEVGVDQISTACRPGHHHW
jgi:hypothetical protein